MDCCLGKRKDYRSNKLQNNSYTSQKKKSSKQSIQQENLQQIKEIHMIINGSKLKAQKQREENYAVQNNEMKQSKLKEDIKLMKFVIDDPDGITGIPIINTFRYDCILTHGIYSANQHQQRESSK